MGADHRTAAMGALAQRLEERAREDPLRVFVCGPAVAWATPVEDLKPSARLRRHVSEKLAEQGYTIFWGEHRAFVEMAGNPWVQKFNDADKEVLFARHTADCTIVFPDSPGSFAELGAFGMHEHIAGRLIVIFDSQHRKTGGFVVEALAQAAKARKATVWFRNYNQRNEIVKAVRRKLADIQMTKLTSLSHDNR